MQNVSVARRYARALLDAAEAESDEVLKQLESLSSFFDGQRELFDVLCSPALPRQQRMTILEAVLRGSGVSGLLQNLLKLLTDRNRFSTLPMVLRQYRDLVDVKLGRVRGKVTSAVKLGDVQLQGIQKSLQALTGRAVLLEAKVEPSLLGGVVAQVGSRTYDGSLKNQLVELGRQLSREVRE